MRFDINSPWFSFWPPPMGFSHHSKHSEKHFMRRNNSEFTKISNTFQLSIESNPGLFWFCFCLLSEFVSTDLAHHTRPTVDICYVKVEDALKLPELLRCLNSLAGSIRYPLSNIGRAKNGNITSMQKVNVDHSTNDSSSKKGEDKSYSFERVLRDWILKMKLKLMVKLKDGKEKPVLSQFVWKIYGCWCLLTRKKQQRKLITFSMALQSKERVTQCFRNMSFWMIKL